LFKLGKAPAKHDNRTLRLEQYAVFPPAPVTSSGKNKALMASCGMLGNDSHGDCVVADDGHIIEMWSNKTVPISDAQAISFYEQASAALNHSSADQGLVMLDFLRWRRKTPWPGSVGRPLVGFATFDHRNREFVKQAINTLGVVKLGILLPKTAQSQSAPGGVWSLLSKTGNGLPGSWGGHDVPAVDYDANYVYVLTWGGVQAMTWEFFDFYVDENYALIPYDQIPGFDMAAFIADLKAIGAYEGPDAPTPPNPPPPPPPPVIVISPASALLQVEKTQQFSANMPVGWVADRGLIGPVTGLYKAPSTPGSATITARSIADPTQFTRAAVSVVAAPPPPPSPVQKAVSLEISGQYKVNYPEGTAPQTGNLSGIIKFPVGMDIGAAEMHIDLAPESPLNESQR
jgi:hypothetical protein